MSEEQKPVSALARLIIWLKADGKNAVVAIIAIAIAAVAIWGKDNTLAAISGLSAIAYSVAARRK